MEDPDTTDSSPASPEKIPPSTNTEHSKLVPESNPPSSPCCVVNRALLPIKMFYFFFVGALGSLAPFIAILLKQYGLSPVQIGIIFGIRPIIGFLSGPLWGIMADKFKIRRILLLLSLVFWISVFVALAFIPPPKRQDHCPDNLSGSTPDETKPEPKLSTSAATDAALNVNVTDLGLTLTEYSTLREDYGWIYEPVTLRQTFLLFMLVILLGEFVQSPTTALGDAATLELLGTEKLDDYGYQRAWGSLGWAITSVSVGTLVSMTRQTEVVCSIPLHFSKYISYVYVFGSFMFFAFVFATCIPFPNEDKKDVEEEEKKKSDDFSCMQIIKIFLNVHYGSWLITTFVVGLFNGCIWGFLNWHLDNLGADELLIGISNVLKCVCEFFMYFVVHRLSGLMGHMGLMYACLGAYTILFVGYALLVNPWFVLILEVLHGCSFSCVWVSLTSYSTLAVPPSSLATVQGILHGVYFGLGNGSGHLLGGVLIGKFGVPITYISFGVTSIITALCLFTAQKCSRKPDKSYEAFDVK